MEPLERQIKGDKALENNEFRRIIGEVNGPDSRESSHSYDSNYGYHEREDEEGYYDGCGVWVTPYDDPENPYDSDDSD